MTIPENIRIALIALKCLPRDNLEMIVKNLAETYEFEDDISWDSFWEYGFIHGNPGYEVIKQVTIYRPWLLTARDNFHKIHHRHLFDYLEDVDVFAWFYEKYPNMEVPYYALKIYLTNNNLSMVKFLYEKVFRTYQKIWFDEYALWLPTINGNLELVMYVYEEIMKPRGITFEKNLVNTAARSGRLDLVKYLYENAFRPNGNDGCDELAISNAIWANSLEIIIYLFENVPYLQYYDFSEEIILANQKGRSEIAEYLQKK